MQATYIVRRNYATMYEISFINCSFIASPGYENVETLNNGMTKFHGYPGRVDGI